MSDTGDIQDRISRRAHEIWEREGHPHGRHDEHWAQAEAEIRAEIAGETAPPPEKTAAKGTRAAARDLSAVGAQDAPPEAPDKPASRKPAPKKPAGKTDAPKAAGAKPPRKDSGKSASAR